MKPRLMRWWWMLMFLGNLIGIAKALGTDPAALWLFVPGAIACLITLHVNEKRGRGSDPQKESTP